MPKIDYKMMRHISKDGFFGREWENFGRIMMYHNNKDRRKAKRFYFGNKKVWSHGNGFCVDLTDKPNYTA